jgi:tetratricopeptide (TPR) repeat protein
VLQVPESYQPKLDELLEEMFGLLKKGDIEGARIKFGLSSNLVTDEEFIHGMISLEQGLILFVQGRQPEAVEHFRKALPIINKSTYKEAKTLIKALIGFAEGYSKLLKGDAYGALPLLGMSTEVIEKFSFFEPELKNAVISLKATSYAALARASLNEGDISAAESWIGKEYDQHEQLLALLNPANEADYIGFVEIYGSRLETAVLFAFMALQSLDLDRMEKRLKSATDNEARLSEFVDKIQSGPMQNVAIVILKLYSVLRDLHKMEKALVFDRSPLNKNRIEIFQHISRELYDAKEIAKRAGERGKGYLYTIDQLEKIRKNLLIAGKIEMRDFGRFAGIISVCALVALMFVLYITIRPSGLLAFLYFIGATIMSLIAGFGFGALRFRPLLKLYLDAVKTKK